MNTVLTNIFKQIILNNKLYDTGALYRSIQVYTSLIGDSVYINISCEDYIKYHIVDYRLTQQFTNYSGFDDQLALIYKPLIENAINESLNNNAPFEFNPRAYITYNGV